MKAVVLAGGLGTRLRGRIGNLPKGMARVAGRPFLEYVLERLAASGITSITLSVGYRADDIESHFGQTFKTVNLSYAREEHPLGTGGAIAHALSTFGEGPTLVVNGDTLLDIDYAAFVEWYYGDPTPVAMVLRHVPDVSRYGAVLVEDELVTGFLEKGNSGGGLINGGVYVVQPDVFNTYGLSGTFAFETDLLQRHCAELRPRGYVTDAYFIDIGTPQDFERAQIEFNLAARSRQSFE